MGGNTFNYVMVFPEMMVFKYSRHVFVRFRITDTEGQPVVGRRLQCVIGAASIQAGMNTNNYRYTDLTGEAIFDIARTLQIMEDTREKEMLQPYDTHLWLQSALPVRIFDTAVTAAQFTIEMANGGERITDNWMSDKRYLKCWSEYPFTFDISNSDRLIIKESGIAQEVAVEELTSNIATQIVRRRLTDVASLGSSIEIALPSDVAGVSFMDGVMLSSNNAVRIDVDRCPQDLSRRAYLRWLGRHGEIFYWLFFIKENSQVTKTETYRRPMTDDGYQGSDPLNRVLPNGEVRDSVTEETMSLYSELMSAEHYEYARSVAFSPYVDMYLGDGKWQRVSVKDSTQTMGAGNGKTKRHRIALTIKTGEE